MNVERKTVLLSGHGQLPQGMAIYEQYKSMTVVMEVDIETDEIVDCAFTVLTPLTNRYMVELIRGHAMLGGLDQLIAEIQERVLLTSQKAMIKALQAANDRYKSCKADRAAKHFANKQETVIC